MKRMPPAGFRWLVPGPFAWSLGGCSGSARGFLGPAGIVAATERQMLFEITLVTLIVVVPVFVLTPLILLRFRRSARSRAYRPEWDSSPRLEWLLWGIPVLIVAGLAYFTWGRTHQLDPYRTLRAGTGAQLEIQVVALDWKWLFIYPELGVASVDELAIPVGRPIKLHLTSGSVMQSFHVPQLAGQIYAMAGMTTQMSFRADRAGAFAGRNTQFNGTGFPDQSFVVRALAPSEFQGWIAIARRDRRTLDDASYAALARRGLSPRPGLFGTVSPGMFARISGDSRMGRPAGAGQPQTTAQ